MRGIEMHNLKFLDNPKYFRRTFWIYFIAITIIVFCAGILIVNTYSDTNNYEEYLSMATELKDSSGDIDDSIKVANVLCQLIQSYDVVEEFAKEKNYNYKNMNFSRITEIARLISSHESEFLNSNMRIALKRADDDMVISMGNTMSSKECIERTGIDFKVIDDKFSENLSPGFYSSVINSVHENTLQLIAKKIYGGGRIVYFGVNFYVDNSTIYYDESIDKVVVHINKDNDNVIELDAAEISAMSNNEIKSMQLSDNQTALLTRSNNYGNVLYIEDFEQEDYVEMRVIVILLFMLCLIAAYAVSLFLARKTYMPIRKIIENIGITMSGEYDEAEAVNDHITRIQNENNILSGMAEERHNLLRNRILDEVLNGFFRATDKELDCYNLLFIKKECIIVLIECNDAEGIYSVKSADEKFSLSTCVAKWLSEQIKDDETVAYSVYNKRILYISSNTDRDIYEILDLIEGARQAFGADLNVAVGNWVQGINRLQDMYLTLESGLDNRQIMKGRDIIMLEEIKAFKQPVRYYPLSLEMELLELVKNGEDAKALNRLERMFGYNEADTGEGFDEFKNLVSVTIRRILKEVDESVVENPNDITEVLTTITECKNRDALFKVVSGVIKDISVSALETTQKNIDALSSKIMEYINENICRDISVNDVIDHFGISASYLTKLLKNNYNISFKKYLNDAKINKAKEIMDCDKTVQIQDVATRVGFNSSVSFIRAFKRVEGITPKQYLDM